MKYDFTTVAGREPEKHGVVKYLSMRDSEGNRPPEGTVPLSVADMEFKTAPCVIEAIKREAEYGILGYHSLTPSFKEACCGWMKKRHDWEIKPEWIVPFPQVVPALYYAVLAFTQPGDGVLIQEPGYPHFKGAVVNTGRTVLSNVLVPDERGRYSLDLEDFRAKAKQAKVFFLCSPQNPTGRVWTEKELRTMGEICREYGVLVVVDEIHHDLIQPGYRHIPYASLEESYAENCIVCTSLSKTFNLAGLCYSSIIIPNRELRKKFYEQMRLLALNGVSRFGPVAHEAAYRFGGEWLDELLQVLKENYEYARDFFTEHFPGVIVTPLEGTYLMWCNFKCFGLSKDEMTRFLTEECRLFLVQGASFGGSSGEYQRINLACPKQVLIDALDRFLKAAEKRGLKG